jgi:hypothetical protein
VFASGWWHAGHQHSNDITWCNDHINQHWTLVHYHYTLPHLYLYLISLSISILVSLSLDYTSLIVYLLMMSSPYISLGAYSA